MALDPSALMFNEHHPLEMIQDNPGARIKISAEFVRVMSEARFSRDETISEYNRTARHELPVDAASPSQRHQSEHATGVALWFESESLPLTPFSADMSAALMVPKRLPDDFGDAGPATV